MAVMTFIKFITTKMLSIIMRKILSAIFLLITVGSAGQETNENIWLEILQNNRSNALQQIKSREINSIQDLITLELVKNENGKFKTDDDFLEKVVAFEDFEYYMYAFWNSHFFFDEYTKSGFNKKNTQNIKFFDTINISESTTKEALKYLKAIVARKNNDWETYFELNDEIPTIKNWQYCGAFENLNSGGLDTAFPPESLPESKDGFDANSNGTVNWYSNEYRKRESYQFLEDHGVYGSTVNYAQTFLESPMEQRIFLRLGASDEVKVWLNDVEIFQKKENYYNDIDAHSIQLTLPKGTSRLLIKLADNSASPYFIARLTNAKGDPIKNVSAVSQPSAYVKSTLEGLQINESQHPVESYFEDKLASERGNFFYAFALIKTYLRNSKYVEAKKVLLEYLEKYPKSSLLRGYMYSIHNLEGDKNSAEELAKNIIHDDGDYYLSYVYRLQDSKTLFQLPVSEFEKFVKDFGDATDYGILKESAVLFLNIRKQDKTAMEAKLDDILEKFEDQHDLLKIYVGLYTSVLEKQEKAIGFYEKLNENYFDYGALLKLARFYDKNGAKEKVIKLFKEKERVLNYDNAFLADYTYYLFKYEKYDRVIALMNAALKNFPFDFTAMEKIGNSLYQKDDKKKALSVYQEYLKHNGANKKVRKRVEELTKTDGLLEAYKVKEVYEYASSNRNKGLPNNYGYNYLLDESLVQIYEQGGGKSIRRYLLEVTSNSGVESLKEINLGLSGSYTMLKYELIKEDGSLKPASKSGSKLVFNDLTPGDVIHIEYNTSWSDTGRFYSDYVDYFQIDSYHPTISRKYVVLMPKNKVLNFSAVNGDVPFTKEEKGRYNSYIWSLENLKGIPQQEDYMPSLNDISRYVHLSTISSWDEIALWYKDLVMPQIKINDEVKKAFDQIFAKDEITVLTDLEKAEKIYRYIADNMSYSYVSFRQSGYIPQEPSKTIKTKLGDCKDLSALFVTLGKMAGIRSHLVLVLTSDYGKNSLVLPNQDFNHCIVKVMIDGKSQYLELTNNNLPFRSLPTSLFNAVFLDIPTFGHQNIKKGVYSIENPDRLVSKINIESEIRIDESPKMKIKTSLQGAVNSSYVSIFKEKKYNSIKKSILEDLTSKMQQTATLDTIYDISTSLQDPKIHYSIEATINNTYDSYEDIVLFKLPFVTNPYESSIIDYKTRNYPIEYSIYENANNYSSKYRLTLPSGQVFSKVPEDVSLTFQDHAYKISYDMISENELEVFSEATTPIRRIKKEDYTDFREYVLKVLDARNRIIGIKKPKA